MVLKHRDIRSNKGANRTMDEMELRAAVQAVAKDGRAACEQLLRLAEEMGVSPREVGRMCDTLKIKICGCQLGCFK